MAKFTGCTKCGRDVDQQGLSRLLELKKMSLPFCSYLCEFLWRRALSADQVRAGAASGPFSLPQI
jgi:hypothetical protein